MKKQQIYTILGVALSLVIAFGGWFVTDGLLTNKESALLSRQGRIPLAVQGSNNPPAAQTGDKQPLAPADHFPRLTASEMYQILLDWESPGTQRPHEPTDGQLSMEQAIGVGKQWLADFSKRGFLPVGVLEYNKANAYLAENISEEISYIAFSNPLYNVDDVRDAALLKPFYSCWVVSFIDGNLDVTLTVNAGTGQVWLAEMVLDVTATDLSGMSDEILAELKTTFADTIGVRGMDGLVGAGAEIIPKSDENGYPKLRLSLSAVQT